MSIAVIVIENKVDKDIDALCAKFLKRINGYHKIELIKLPSARLRDPLAQKAKESETIMAQFKPTDTVLLCDELGKEYTSVGFATLLEQEFSQLRGRLVFVIGGAYGFTDELKKSNTLIRLSKFVFPHHLARFVLIEQIYRWLCIQRNMPYHHE